MKNNKGHVLLGLVYAHLGSTVIAITAFKMAFAAIALAAMWHIPAWEAAKDSHTEAKYQATEQFPQQLFDKLPGGTPGRTLTTPAAGNGGNVGG